MNFDGYELQIFISVLGILASAFLALLVDYLKSTNEKLRESNAQLLAKHDSLAERASGDTKKILGVLGEQTVALKRVIEQPIRLAPAGMDYRDGYRDGNYREGIGHRDPYGRMRPFGPMRPPAPLVVREIPAPRREAVQEVASSADRVKILPEEKVAAALKDGGALEALEVKPDAVPEQVAGRLDLLSAKAARGAEDALPPNVVRIRLTPESSRAKTEDSSRAKTETPRQLDDRFAAEELEDGQRLEDIVIADEVLMPVAPVREVPVLSEEIPDAVAPVAEVIAEARVSADEAPVSAIEAPEEVQTAPIEEAPPVVAVGEFDRFMEEMVEEFDAHPERYALPTESNPEPAPESVPEIEAEVPAAFELQAEANPSFEVLPLAEALPVLDPVSLEAPVAAPEPEKVQWPEAVQWEEKAHWADEAHWGNQEHWSKQDTLAQANPDSTSAYQPAQYVEPAYVAPTYVQPATVAELRAGYEAPATSFIETPIAEAPIAEAPVVEAPVVEAPVVEAPVLDASVLDAPMAEALPSEPEEASAHPHAVEEMVPMLDVPAGTYPAEALAELMERRETLTGLVVAIGINEFSQIHENLGRNAADQLLSSVDQLMSSLAGREGFCTRHQADEFVLIFPKLVGPAAQRSLSDLSERLWDFQLRNLGTFSVVFSWGAMEAQREPLRDAMSVAQERMKETQASRRTVSMTGGRRRRVS